MKEDFERSVQAAELEFQEEPMDENYRHPIVGMISAGRVRRLIREMMPLRGKRILDVGCEAGFVSLQLEKRGAVMYGFDIVFPALEAYQKKKSANSARILHATAQKMPIADGAFDAVVCTEVIEHMPHVEKGIAEMHRVLRSGGRLYLTFPNEKLRKPFYPLARLMGINTSVEDEVTLFDYRFRDILAICRRHFIIEKKFSWPWFIPLTRFIVARKAESP